ncbi:MAG: bifunctional phosphoglucose/phosphomannose isomerase, partial [candidate division Zixibacteria bacterium]|nr:bifunctional phosphoglucose/phosphomannose isomerase [candidate division Zixibacteria bacterium]
IENIEEQVKTAIESLKTFREDYTEDTQTSANPAKQLAEKLQGKVVMVYSGPTLTDAVAVRWKGQFCENSKTLAFANQFPEFNHNELVGWSDVTRKFTDKLAAIILRDSADHPQVKKRMDIVNPLIEETGADVMEVQSRGSTELERILSLIQMGDFVSYYLAILNDQDPTPVLSIEMLKDALSDKDV